MTLASDHSSQVRASSAVQLGLDPVAEGHQVANHGYDHGILIFRGPAHVRDQLARACGRARVAGQLAVGELALDAIEHFGVERGFRRHNPAGGQAAAPVAP